MKHVFVFKTSVTTKAEVSNLSTHLNRLIQHDGRWNFDLEDCDNILRVECAACNADHVIEVLQIAGYTCEALQ